MKYYIQTLGCAMNYSDSERVAAALGKLGHSPAKKESEADLYIFNTCSIRQKGEDRVYGKLMTLGERKQREKDLLIGITGCMVRKTSTKKSPREKMDKLVRDLKPVDFVFRIEDAGELGKILKMAAKKPSVRAINKAAKAKRIRGAAKAAREIVTDSVDRLDYLDIAPKYSSGFQAFVPIQIGCDKFCTYCIVPYARGREQARPIKEILAECRTLVEKGCKEITLVGQTVNSYGRSDLDKKSGHAYGRGFVETLTKSAQLQFAKEPFVALLTEVDKLHAQGLNRLRFTSPHPYDYSDALIKAHAKLKTLTPHFHIPVQAGSDETLKRMNRRYSAADYKKLIKKIRALIPDASVTTDIIVGFCGETKKDFEKTLKLYKDIKWDMAYLARYSPRPGTVSQKFFKDDVPRAEKARRWHALNTVLTKSSRDYNKKLIGKTLEVLVEKYDARTNECEGKSRENKLVQFPAPASKGLSLVGTIQKVKITKALEWNLKGEIR
jgi:tRNA-2-methylthio-N6-dimethylallyladenosine synthase